MNKLIIKGTDIGAGKTKICVPIVGRTEAAILQVATEVLSTHAEIVEWRCDFFEGWKDKSRVLSLLEKISKIFVEIPLIFTFRTAAEGGSQITSAEYIDLYSTVIESQFIDLLDIEAFREPRVVKQALEHAKSHDIKVILSYHDFKTTEATEEINKRLKRMETLGADICKVAYTAKDEDDLANTVQACEYAKQEKLVFIVISMGCVGIKTRTHANELGSCITFGSLQQESAPGQVEVEKLYRILK